eukprot:2706712-Rhodomonas_salina.2
MLFSSAGPPRRCLQPPGCAGLSVLVAVRDRWHQHKRDRQHAYLQHPDASPLPSPLLRRVRAPDGGLQSAGRRALVLEGAGCQRPLGHHREPKCGGTAPCMLASDLLAPHARLQPTRAVALRNNVAGRQRASDASLGCENSCSLLCVSPRGQHALGVTAQGGASCVEPACLAMHAQAPDSRLQRAHRHLAHVLVAVHRTRHVGSQLPSSNAQHIPPPR